MDRVSTPQCHITCEEDSKLQIDEDAQTALNVLNTDCNDLVAVCLHGTGGIGKSTLGLHIFEGLQRTIGKPFRFCKVVLASNIQIQDLPSVQVEILEKAGQDVFFKFSDVKEGKEAMQRAFTNLTGPLFLYIDSVREPGHLHELLPESAAFPEGSRILVTTRSVEHVIAGFKLLDINHYSCIEVKKLGEQQAMEVFRLQFEKQGKGKSDHERRDSELGEVEMEVVRLCDGVPLALEVVGSIIASNQEVLNLGFWKEVMEVMRREESLFSRIKGSIHKINPELKRAFLDIIVFLVGQPWERAELLVGKFRLAQLQCHALVRRRKRDCDGLHVVEVHHVIAEIGMQVAEADEEEVRINCPANCRSVAEMHDNELYINGVAKLSAGSWKRVVGLGNVELSEARILQQLPCLRVMMDVDIRGECPTACLKQLAVVCRQRSDAHIPYDLRHCTHLRELSWQCDVELDLNLEDLTGAKDLEVLEIDGGGRLENIEMIETFERLRILRLSRFTGFKCLPKGIARLMELRELDLSLGRSLRGLPEEMECLTGLRKLDLSGCSSLESLPQGLSRLMRLKELDISNCESLRYLPEGISCMPCMERLSFVGCCGLRALPNGVARMLTGLDRLNLRQFESLPSLPEDISLLTSLKELDLRRCRSLEVLPQGISSLTSLEAMHLYGCISLEALPEGISSLTSLRRLNLGECERLIFLPEGLASLTRLKKLELHTCRMLRALPDGISSLTGLEVIDLCKCHSLLSLPEGILSLTRLGRLSMGECTSLQSLPRDISSLRSLRRLELWGCRGLHQAPEQLKSLSGSLKVVDLRGCEGSHWLVGHGSCSWLQGLTVVDLPVDEWDDTYEISVCMILRSTGATMVLMDLSQLAAPLPSGVTIMSSMDLLERFEASDLDS